jgi:tetratricopeptide (TPR) repeat protein
MDNLAVKEYLTQGTVLAGLGKFEEALTYFDKAERENPMEIDVYLSKGIALANLEKLDEAKEQFEKALKINRASGLAHFHLGSIALMQGDAALGFELYNKAIADGYDDAQLYYSIALLHEESGDADQAVRNYTKAIALDPMRPDIRLRKAYLLFENDQIPEALQTLDEAILASPDVFEGYHLKFMFLVQLKQYDKAEKVLEQATALFPKDAGFVLDKVTLLMEQEKFDEATALLNTLENTEGVDDTIRRSIYMDRAQMLASKDDVAAAIIELEKAKTLSEKNGEFDSEVVFLLTNSYLSQESYETVLAHARQILEKSEVSDHKAAARYYEPLSLKMLDRMDEASPLYTEAISEYRNQSISSPGNIDAYLYRVMCLRDIGQPDKALELIDYVIALQPERHEPRLLRAAVLEALGRTDEAAEEAKNASKMLPEELRG